MMGSPPSISGLRVTYLDTDVVVIDSIHTGAISPQYSFSFVGMIAMLTKDEV